MPVILDSLEKELPKRAHWVADLTETLRNHQIAGTSFPLIGRGGTRPKGFLLSRFFAVTMMPNYSVCMYVDMLDSAERNSKNRMLRDVRVIETQADRKNIKWSWLLMLGEDEPDTSVVRFIEEFGNEGVGVGYLNIVNGSIITSSNQLGKSMKAQMRLGRLIADLRKRSSYS